MYASLQPPWPAHNPCTPPWLGIGTKARLLQEVDDDELRVHHDALDVGIGEPTIVLCTSLLFCVYIYVYIYIYTYRERERERKLMMIIYTHPLLWEG